MPARPDVSVYDLAALHARIARTWTRRERSAVELGELIAECRQRGESWRQIETATSVPRTTAQRLLDAWRHRNGDKR